MCLFVLSTRGKPCSTFFSLHLLSTAVPMLSSSHLLFLLLPPPKPSSRGPCRRENTPRRVSDCLAIMSSFFRGIRTDNVNSELISEKRAVACFSGSVVLLLLIILNFSHITATILLWLVLVVFFTITVLWMHVNCQQAQSDGDAEDLDSVEGGQGGQTVQRVHPPPSIPYATRGQLTNLRIQLALLDHDFDDLDYEALRALDADITDAPPMSQEAINALPLRKYVSPRQSSTSGLRRQLSNGSSLQQASSSSIVRSQRMQDDTLADESLRFPENEMTCSVCLEEVNAGDLIRSLPCLHEFHAVCIDQWLRQQGTCPICKYRLT